MCGCHGDDYNNVSHRPPKIIAMEMFGDDEDGTSDELQDALNQLFTLLVKRRSSIKDLTSTTIPTLRIAIIRPSVLPLEHLICDFEQRLQAAKFTGAISFESMSSIEGMYDALVNFDNINEVEYLSKINKIVIPEGFVFCVRSSINHAEISFGSGVELVNCVTTTVDGVSLTATLHTRSMIECNPHGALYWATLSDQLEREALSAQAVTVCLTTHEREQASLSQISHMKACVSLKEHGICIVRGIFDKDRISSIANFVLKDLELAKGKLLDKGIDLTKPGCGGEKLK